MCTKWVLTLDFGLLFSSFVPSFNRKFYVSKIRSPYLENHDAVCQTNTFLTCNCAVNKKKLPLVDTLIHSLALCSFFFNPVSCFHPHLSLCQVDFYALSFLRSRTFKIESSLQDFAFIFPELHLDWSLTIPFSVELCLSLVSFIPLWVKCRGSNLTSFCLKPQPERNRAVWGLCECVRGECWSVLDCCRAKELKLCIVYGAIQYLHFSLVPEHQKKCTKRTN